MFLGLEVGNPATIKMPKACKPRGSDIECSGWQLANADAEYLDFAISVEEVTGRRNKTFTKFVFTAIDDSVQAGEEVNFVNTCGAVDANGDYEETASILVVAYDMGV